MADVDTGGFNVAYGVVLDDDGSTDVYPTLEEAVTAYAPGCRVLRIETRDTDITDQVVPLCKEEQ